MYKLIVTKKTYNAKILTQLESFPLTLSSFRDCNRHSTDFLDMKMRRSTTRRAAAMLLATLASTHAFAPVLPATARRATVVPQMAGNFFDNAAKNAANAAAKLVTGADQEENDLMEAKMKAGTIDFNDFLRQSEMMAKAAGVGQAITNVGINLPGGMDKKQMAQATKKLEVRAQERASALPMHTAHAIESPLPFEKGEGRGGVVS